MINTQREKLTQAVLFFSHRVKLLGKVKLFKLLYFLDFEHFRDTGRSVTGLDYFAWPKGPVPVQLFNELDASEVRWDEKVQFRKTELAGRNGWMLKVIPLASFDPSVFSRRELALLEKLADEFRDTPADEMVEATHLENSPWHKVWDQEKRKQEQIPYAYALRGQEKEQMERLIAERNETIKLLSK